jgi:hypothetical protein
MVERVKAAGKKVVSGKIKPEENIPAGTEVEGLVAVIVGIDGYKDLRPLHCAVNDAVSLTETFKKVWPGCDITTLVWAQVEKSVEQEKGWGIRLPGNASSVTRQSILEKVRQSKSFKCQANFYLNGLILIFF